MQLGELISGRIALFETWSLAGEHVEVQVLSFEEGDPRALALLGLLAERYRVRCPHCGLDIVAGDRLGGHPGLDSLARAREQNAGLPASEWTSPSTTVNPRVSIAETTDDVLSQLADRGLTRLSLSALGRILSM